MRTNYLLVDFENVTPEAIELLPPDQFKVLVFVGAQQTKIPIDMAAALQQFGTRAEYIRITGHGRNALDFHIAYYLGQLVSNDSLGFFHILSKDAGFDPLIEHLREKKIFIDRVDSISRIPLIRVANCNSVTDRADMVLTRLIQMKSAKPRTLKTLSSTIASLFQKKLTEDEVTEIIQHFVNLQQLEITGTKVTYSLTSHEH